MGKAARIKRERAQALPKAGDWHHVRLGDVSADVMRLTAHGKSFPVDLSDWESGAQVDCPICGLELEDEDTFG